MSIHENRPDLSILLELCNFVHLGEILIKLHQGWYNL